MFHKILNKLFNKDFALTNEKINNIIHNIIKEHYITGKEKENISLDSFYILEHNPLYKRIKFKVRYDYSIENPPFFKYGIVTIFKDGDFYFNKQ